MRIDAYITHRKRAEALGVPGGNTWRVWAGGCMMLGNGIDCRTMANDPLVAYQGLLDILAIEGEHIL